MLARGDIVSDAANGLWVGTPAGERVDLNATLAGLVNCATTGACGAVPDVRLDAGLVGRGALAGAGA